MSIYRIKQENVSHSRSHSRDDRPQRQSLPINFKTESRGDSGGAKMEPQEQGMDLSENSSGRSNTLFVKKTKTVRSSQFDYNRSVRNDVSLMPPIRQTASIFKQPVTVIRTQQGGKVTQDLKIGNQEKPKQLFWEKRLEGLRACDVDGRELEVMNLPKGFATSAGHIGPETALQSVVTALHLSATPVAGQACQKSKLDTNPGIFTNPEQPLIQAISISEEDIRRQEERVAEARKKLKRVLVER